MRSAQVLVKTLETVAAQQSSKWLFQTARCRSVFTQKLGVAVSLRQRGFAAILLAAGI